jgi:two-component system sensor histidine kinase VicK
MYKLKIREKILIFSILISAIPIALVNTYWFINATSLVKKDAGEHLVMTNQQITSKFDDFLNTKLLGFLSHSQGAALLSKDQQLIQIDLFNLLLQDSDISEIAYVDTKGREVAKVSTKKLYAKNELQDLSSSDAFKIVNFQYGKEFIGPVTFTDKKFPQILIAVPIVNPGKLPALQTFSSESLLSRRPSEIHGFLFGTVNLNKIYKSISALKIGKTGYSYVVNREGKIIMHPDGSYIGTEKNSQNTEIALYLEQVGNSKTSSFHETEGIDKEHVLSTHNIVSRTNWGIITEEPTTDISTDINGVQRQALPLVVIPLAGVIVFSFFWSKRLTTPIKQLAIGAHKIGAGDFSYKFSIDSHDELRALAESLKQMAENLKDSQGKIQHERDSLRIERDKLESVLTNIDDGVIALNDAMEILFFNKAVEMILKIKLKESTGNTLDSLMTLSKENDDTTFMQYIKEIKPDDKPAILSFATKFKDEGKIRIAVTKIASTHASDIKYLCTIQDVTKEQQLEEMKLDFVSMAAHELRTPLTSIRGYFSLVNTELAEKMTEQQKMFMNRIDISTQQLVTLVENLLSVTRIEKGTYTVKKSNTDLEGLIEQDIKDFHTRIAEKDIELSFKKMTTKLPEIYIDQLGISEVIRNLLSNAIAYTPPGGKIIIWLEKTDKEIITYVKDTGEGIPKEAIPHLFTKFFRVSGSLEQGSKGNGLGLYISKSILDIHHGRIEVESEFGKGSTFSFALPIQKYEAENNTH